MLTTKMVPAFFRLLLCGSALVFFSGCTAIVVGGASAGGAVYVLGEMKAEVEASPADLTQAIEEAGDELKLIRITGGGDDLTGRFVSRTADDRKIVIKYERITDDLMKLKIRVGLIGDRVLSEKVFKTIAEQLR